MDWRLDYLRRHHANKSYWAWERETITHLYRNWGLDAYQISSNFLIPYSTVLRFWNEEHKDKNSEESDSKRTYCKHIWKEAVLDFIKVFLQSNQSYFNICDVSRQIKEDLDLSVDAQFIRNALKQNFKFSYKRVSARPCHKDSDKHILLRKLFAIEFASLLHSRLLIVNTDEVLFSNKTKWNYSWTAKGKATNSKNIMFSGSK